ncbi:MAG TPA: GNAT family N-acetyltransferase [Caulobacteraceae bacterium]|nr:GNAT family N-acetyltransferase [Caulobacteraceae bacterium]
MAGPFIPTQDDVRRAQAIVGAYARTRLETIAARPGNPRGGEFRSFDGGAVALRMPGFPGSAFNNAYGFSDEHIEAIPGLIDWYKAGVGGAFALAPGAATVKTAGLLADAGFRLSVWHATMIGPPELPSAEAPGVTIEPVTDEAALGPFADVYHRGWNYTAFRIPMQSWLTAPGWRLYLARFEGEPAGAAILYLDGEDGYLADGAVDPDFRHHGVHRALLDRRVDDARAAGAKRIVSGCNYLSGSFRNQLRKGLSLLFTETFWALPPPAR